MLQLGINIKEINMNCFIWLTKEEFELVTSLRGIMRTQELTRIVKHKTTDFRNVLGPKKRIVQKFEVRPVVQALEEELNIFVGT